MRLSALLFAGGLAVAACSGGGAAVAAPRFVTPEDGAEVTNPVTVRAAVEGIRLEAAGRAVAGAGHLHVMVDAACVPAGRAVPQDDRHLHLGDGSDSVMLSLPPGPHRLCLQLGDGEHVVVSEGTEIEVVVVAP